MFILSPLPYTLTALEPVIDAQTVELHYTKHHQGYVNKLNELIAGTPYEGKSLEDIIKSSDGPVFNNAAQMRNHDLYRSILQSPQENNLPTWKILDALVDKRESFEAFQTAMIASAVGNFWSGRTWLVQHSDGSLEIMNTSNAWNPLTADKKALFGIDIWEHAYYLKYQNRRVEYVTNIFKCINRSKVNEIFSQ